MHFVSVSLSALICFQMLANRLAKSFPWTQFQYQRQLSWSLRRQSFAFYQLRAEFALTPLFYLQRIQTYSLQLLFQRFIENQNQLYSYYYYYFELDLILRYYLQMMMILARMEALKWFSQVATSQKDLKLSSCFRKFILLSQLSPPIYASYGHQLHQLCFLVVIFHLRRFPSHSPLIAPL